MGCFIYSFLLPNLISSGHHNSTSLSQLLSTSFTRVEFHSPSRQLHPPLASLFHSSLRPAPRACVFRHITHPTAPPLPHLACTKIPVGPWDFARHRSLHLGCRIGMYRHEGSVLIVYPSTHQHYFSSYVRNGEINIHNIWTDKNLASFMTKPSNKGRHTCHWLCK